MEVAFHLGPLSVRWYSICMVVAIVVGAFLMTKEAKRRGENPEHVVSMLILAIPLGLVGARLYHVISDWDFYSHNPTLIFAIWKTKGGLGIFGVIAGGLLGFFTYAKWKGLSIPRWLDICAPSLILGQAIGRWGNFFNQELYGPPTNLPWGIYIDPAHRFSEFRNFDHFHPLFLYESLWNLLGFFILLLLGRKFGHRLQDGDIFLAYFIYYPLGRFFIEGLRIEPWTTAGIPTARWICVIAIVASIAIIVFRKRRLHHNTKI